MAEPDIHDAMCQVLDGEPTDGAIFLNTALREIK